MGVDLFLPTARLFGVRERTLWWGMLLSVGSAFSLSILLPNIWQHLDATYPFRGVEIMGTDQEDFYVARLREVQDGFWFLGNVYRTEGKGLPWVQPALAEWVMGGVGFLLHLDAVRTMLLMKVVLGTLLTVCMAFFCAYITRRPWWSLLAVSSVLFAWFLFSSPSVFFGTLSGSVSGTGFLRFSRPPHPLFSSTIFFGALWAFLVWLDSHKRGPLLISALLTGASFYDYPYTWTYIGVILTCTGLRALIRQDWRILRGLSLFGCVVLAVATPYVLHQVALLDHPAYDDVMRRLGVVYTHSPIFSWSLVLLLCMSVIERKRIGQYGWLVIAIALAGIVVMNQQVVTGIIVAPHHYHWYFNHPLSLLFTILIIGPYIERVFLHTLGQRGKVLGFLFVLCSFIALGIDFQRDSFQEVRAIWGQRQKVANVLSFLERNTDTRTSVYTVDILQSLIPVYTSANVYYASNGQICLCSDEQLREEYFLDLWLQGVTPEEAERVLPTIRRAELSSRLHSIYFREASGGYDRIPDEEVDDAIRAYREYFALSVEGKIVRYPLHLLAIPRGWEFRSSPGFRELHGRSSLVYEDSFYEVWELQGRSQSS